MDTGLDTGFGYGFDLLNGIFCAAQQPATCGSSLQGRDRSYWEQIDWAECERQVGRLQARIVKATREGRRGKVKTLQRLLTHSFSGKALAVKRVTENQGKRTPGVDKVLWETPEKKTQAIRDLRQRCYSLRVHPVRVPRI